MAGRRWSVKAVQRLRFGARRKEPARSIARAVRRTPDAVRAKAARMRLTFKARS